MNDTSKANQIFAILAVAFLFVCAADPVVKIAADLGARNLIPLPFSKSTANVSITPPESTLPAPDAYEVENKKSDPTGGEEEKEVIRKMVSDAKAANVEAKKRAMPLPFSNVLNAFASKIYQLKGIAVVWVQNKFKYKDELSGLNMYFRKYVGMKMPMSAEGENLVINDDGYMIDIFFSGRKLSQYADANTAVAKAIYDEAKKDGINMLFVIRPEKGILTGDEEYLKVSRYYENEFQKNGIPVFNMLDKFNSMPDKQSLFLKSDHHWNSRGAMTGAGMIAEELNKRFGFSYDLRYFKPQYFEKITFEKAAVGSHGKKVGTYWDDGEDVTYFLPTFETRFEFEVPFQNAVFDCDFSSFLYADDFYKDKSIFERSSYTFMLSDASLLKIRNVKTKDRKKILLIQDSFSRASDPYLALQTYELCMIDPRYKNCPDILAFIRSYKPDAVIFMYRPNAIVEVFSFSWDDAKFAVGKRMNFEPEGAAKHE